MSLLAEWAPGPCPQTWQRHPPEGWGLIGAPRQMAGGRHMHLVLGPSCPPLQPPNWVEQGGVGTGGAGKGVPRSPAGVDPKETPFTTKHLAGKLRTRHKQRLVGKRQVGRAWGAARWSWPPVAGGREGPPTQIILQPTFPECRHSRDLHEDLLGRRLNKQTSVSVLQRFSFWGPGERSSYLHFQQIPHRMLMQEASGPCFEKHCFSMLSQNPKERRRWH